MCDNCHRKNYSNDGVYSLNLIRVPFEQCNKNNINKQNCFLHQAEEVVLCKYCNDLFHPNHKVIYDSVWPSFIWIFLNENNRKFYGQRVWSVIPLLWRRWWLDSVKIFPEFSNVTLLKPDAVVKDVSKVTINFHSLTATCNCSSMQLIFNTDGTLSLRI